MTNDTQLYTYQQEMVGRIEAAFKLHRAVMVQMPTGTGKTYLLASLVWAELWRREKGCVWIVVHRQELVEQIEETLRTFGEKLDDPCDTPNNLNDTHNNNTNNTSNNSSHTHKDASEKLSYKTGSPPTISRITTRVRVTSIQWLSRHYSELEERPSLLVIDEAHHAVAKSYAGLMNAYPEAKKLGLTATPCRLRRGGFTELFEVLLQSWTMKKFIAMGQLSLYDYWSIKENSEAQRQIFGLTQRGADGDFSLREMSEKLDVRPSIQRLCDTVLRYAAQKKGITYAIDIAHAEHIAEEYRRQGIRAVAISSRTPKDERRRIIELFKRTNLMVDAACRNLQCPLQKGEKAAKGIQVLVNVDLFGEGFDCPDVEFIQLARPTLSLAKYLQQVGRGMRRVEGKNYCLILDNVGLYRLFGLPSDDRDWQALFEGRLAGKGLLAQAKQSPSAAYAISSTAQGAASRGEHTELILVMTHDGQRLDLEAAYGYQIAESEEGLMGVTDIDDREVLPCLYNKVELKAYGLAKLHSRKRIDRERPWMDLLNGVRFVKRPKVERCGFLDFSTTDGLRLYPRVRTRLMDENCFVLAEALQYGLNEELRFQKFLIHSAEPNKLYVIKDRLDAAELWQDELGNWAWRKEESEPLQPTTLSEWLEKKAAWEEEVKRFKEEVEECIRYFKPQISLGDLSGKCLLADYEEPQSLRIVGNEGKHYQVYCRESGMDRWQSVGSFTNVFPPAYGLRVVQNWEGKYLLRTALCQPLYRPELEFDYAELQDNATFYFTERGRAYWVYLENKLCFTRKPEFVTIGFLEFIKVGEVYMERTAYSRQTYRRTEIRMYDQLCFLGSKSVVIRSKYRRHYFDIQQRYSDGKRFILTERSDPNSSVYDLYFDGKNAPIIKRRKKLYEMKELS